MFRKSLVIAIAVTASILLSRISADWQPLDSGGVHYIGPVGLTPWYLKFAGLVGLLRLLLPGFIIGALLGSRQLMAAALVSASAMLVTEVLIVLHFGYKFPAVADVLKMPMNQWPSQSLVVSIIAYGAFGALGAVFGRVLQGFYNSHRSKNDMASS